MQSWQARIAPSLGGGFAGHPNEVWGTKPYTDPNTSCVFFGMYGLRDFSVLLAHQGQRVILWAGSDIRNYLNDYWLDTQGTQKLPVVFPTDVEHYVENSLEQYALASKGIYAHVIPSFLGNVDDYPVQELRTDKKRYYTSVSGDDFELYGWHEIDKIARENPDTEYHLYGNTKEWTTTEKNVIIHGRITQEEMNEEVKTMTGALRLTHFDGASEILVKSTLWGQQPLSPYIPYNWLGNREALLAQVNNYPWNAKAH